MATLALLGILIAGFQLEPTIQWHFHARACTVCVEAQTSLMEAYYRSGDTVVIYSEKPAQDRESIEQIESILKQRVVTEISVSKKNIVFGVGWQYYDVHLGEEISFGSTKGNYNPWRAAEMLRLVRSAPTRK